jgi:hypothetical protein
MPPARLFAMDENTGAKGGAEYELRFDPYYSSINMFASLTDKPIPDAGEKGELEIYKDLFLSSYIPRFIVLEASLNPLPVLGVMVKSNLEDVYEKSDISESLNLVQAVTAGFEEPYAFSVFLGNVVNFTKPGEKKGGNKGYIGYLFSFGDYHIKENELIRDDWYEIEWKIKGDRDSSEKSIHWSFRVGLKIHDKNEIADTVYLSLRRSRLDYTASAHSLLKNSGFQYTFDMDKGNFEGLRHYFFVNKKWPLKSMRAAFTLDLGFIWDSKNKYSGDLIAEDTGDYFQLIIRPNIEF